MLRVLFIEDSDDFREFVIRQLRSHYEFTTASTLKEARQRLKDKPYDLVLLDVTLPDGSGIEFCSELRNSEQAFMTPVIFLTGNIATEAKVEGLDIGADDYITKPCEIRELRARMEAHARHASVR